MDQGGNYWTLFTPGIWKVLHAVLHYKAPCPTLKADMEDIDWTACDDVEIVPGKVSGAWLVVGTRIPADAVIDNAEDGFTAEQIVAEIYPSLPLERARRIIAYAATRANAPHPA